MYMCGCTHTQICVMQHRFNCHNVFVSTRVLACHGFKDFRDVQYVKWYLYILSPDYESHALVLFSSIFINVPIPCVCGFSMVAYASGVFQHILCALPTPTHYHFTGAAFTVLTSVLDADITPLLHSLTSTPASKLSLVCFSTHLYPLIMHTCLLLYNTCTYML